MAVLQCSVQCPEILMSYKFKKIFFKKLKASALHTIMKCSLKAANLLLHM